MFLFFLWYELSFLPTCLLWYTWVNQLLRLEFWSQTAEIWWVCVFFFYPLINHWASLQDVLGLTHLYFWWVCKWLLSFHVTDGICAKHVIDQIAPIGKDQILRVVKGIIFHSGFTDGKEEKKEKFSHLQKRGCVIPEVIEHAREWGWLWDFIMVLNFQFVGLSMVSFSPSNSASQKESLVQRRRVSLPEKSLLEHPEPLIALYLICH